MRALGVVVVGMVTLAACTPAAAPPAGASSTPTLRGTVRNTCAPWDGAAMGIDLFYGEPPGCKVLVGAQSDGLHISLWRAALPLHVGSFDLAGDTNGHAVVCPKPAACQAVTSAVVEISAVDGEAVRGRLRGTGPGGETLDVAFAVTPCAHAPRCG